MFNSSFEGGIDAKGRVSIPASFRAALGTEQKVHVYPAVDGSGCLEGGGEALMALNRAILARMNPVDPVTHSFKHSIFSRSFDLPLDSTGRISLPKALMDLGGFSDRVVFAGLDDRFQIWDPARYEAYSARMTQLAQENTHRLADPFREVIDAMAAGGAR
jgi:MraZ protein